ncbi:MAG: aminotransferase class I/II-fold pyridoxal phosphate-dependent enzyme [Rhodospirillales bacterium]
MSETGFAERTGNITSSQSLAIIAEVKALRERGADIVDFGKQGHTPSIARDVAARTMHSPVGEFYSNPRGLPELRRTIAGKLRSENSIDADPDAEIIVTVGAKQGILTALLALVGPGDEVLIDDPGWISFAPMVRITGATPVVIPLAEENGFRSPADNIRNRITPRTRLMVLCNPHNPTGRCLDRGELLEIATLAQEFGLRVLMDEAYEHFAYDGKAFISMASLPGMSGITITARTVSKIYNMSGWRIGWVVASPEIVNRMLSIHTHAVSCPSTAAQAGAEAAIAAGIGEGDLPIAEIVANYENQRNAMISGLRRIPGVTCFKPEGAFFAFPGIHHFGMSSIEMSHFLLNEAGVATIPGSAFGEAGEGHVRLVFKTGVPEIERGLARIAQALSTLNLSD